ncbi:MAG: 2-C-methyl-D-erythritol 2,4-cyclodiphosphate synthase [candidate division WOR-3 bacterium]|nr:2-C-methyl-D-erythritol 2,4-cyclodiphosphate synthase [candidate division WOR-3 bacterium]MCX7836870.1 2-C-methyl-D-erythritol 2,4-cyclodiphosphate synthase [candidate division WOR-3 bacterium]MDW8114334.1 2-C-methyl-D-erythritol 2,4-cyclodiphosphate synthase [candidate division WOR-3 bacterium]
MKELKIGLGFDSHPLRRKRKLIIGGVEIPSNYGLFGHSDADLLFHALSDALLGSIGEYDIGYYFPNTNEKIKGISSSIILKEVYKKVKKKGYKVKNVDAIIMIDKPKIIPYISKMKENISKLLKVKKENIGIKAKTFEGFNFKNVASCFCCVLIEKKK